MNPGEWVPTSRRIVAQKTVYDDNGKAERVDVEVVTWQRVWQKRKYHNARAYSRPPHKLRPQLQRAA